MRQYIFAFAILAILIFAGCAGYGTRQTTTAPAPQGAEEKAMGEKNAVLEKNNSTGMIKSESPEMEQKEKQAGSVMKENNSNSSMRKEGSMMEPGKASYSNYNAAAYQKALSAGKVVYLEFYAAWCPDCRAYEPRLLQAFGTMSSDPKFNGVVGFKVNYDTQDDLKSQFGIVGQHTHIIIGKDGSVAVKSREIWSAQNLVDNIGKAL